jgi:hypothetical protein
MSSEISIMQWPPYRPMSPKPLQMLVRMLAEAKCNPMESNFDGYTQQWIRIAITGSQFGAYYHTFKGVMKS